MALPNNKDESTAAFRPQKQRSRSGGNQINKEYKTTAVLFFWGCPLWSVLVLTAPSEPRDCCYGQPLALKTYCSFGTPHLNCIGEIAP